MACASWIASLSFGGKPNEFIETRSEKALERKEKHPDERSRSSHKITDLQKQTKESISEPKKYMLPVSNL